MKHMYSHSLFIYCVLVTSTPMMSIDMSSAKPSAAQLNEIDKNLRALRVTRYENLTELEHIRTNPYYRHRIRVWLENNPGKSRNDYTQYLSSTEQRLLQNNQELDKQIKELEAKYAETEKLIKAFPGNNKESPK